MYKEAVKALEEAINANPENDSLYANLANFFFLLGDLESASSKVEEAIGINNKNVPALILKGRICIEKKDYGDAIQYFKKAICLDLGNPLPLLWKIYAEYLNLKAHFDAESREYQEEIGMIIRNLEAVNELCEKSRGDELKAFILYFLGCFYHKNGDISTAKEKLEECINLRSWKEKLEEYINPTLKSPIVRRACELLSTIWNYEMRPTWWQWWLSSPSFAWLKRGLFFTFLFSIFSLLAFHPFIPMWFSIEMNWSIYIISIAFLIFILLSPGIQTIRAEGFGLELRSRFPLEVRSEPPFELALSPPMMEPKVMQELIVSSNERFMTQYLKNI